MSNLRGKTIFITGGSRGIGKAIGLRAARDGANIVIAAKTTQPHPKLPGTIYTAAEEMRAAGGEGLACMVDIRSEELVQAAIDKAVETFGGIDILINNASAISLTGTQHTKMKRFDLMHEVNTRGTFMTSKLCIPHLKKADNPHVLNLSPPLNMTPHWFAPYVAYTMAKYGMSMCVLGMAQEFKKQGIAFNALWPKTTIATAAIKFIVGGEAMMAKSRTPQIVADAAYAILTRNSRHCTGNFFIDEDVLREEGETNFSQYQVNPDLDQSKLMPDLFL